MVQRLQEDPRTSEEEHFRIVLIQTETERVKFLIRSYLRTRLNKVDLFSIPDAYTRLMTMHRSKSMRHT
jgi:GINS complex subunit 4